MLEAIRNEREIRILAPNGQVGSGFLESSFEAGLARRPHMIGWDAGSTDSGAESLGTAQPSRTKRALMRDLRIVLKGARSHDIPLVIGSCFGGGTDNTLEMAEEWIRQIADEEGLSFNLATIRSELSIDFVRSRYEEGRVRPLVNAPVLDGASFARMAHIVGMMGHEPFVAALDNGADVILAGRSSDAAIFAAPALRAGFAPELSWHAGKILECAAAACTHKKSPDCAMVTIRADHFVYEPLDPDLRCTPQSVAAHSLYETSDAILHHEPSGVLDLTTAVYEALSERQVKVSGGTFREADVCTIKLEGSEFVGHSQLVVGSTRDPFIIDQLDDFLVRLRDKARRRVDQVLGTGQAYDLVIHVYGKNGTLGSHETVRREQPHEICLVCKIIAEDQETSKVIASMFRHQLLHLPIPEWSGSISGFAYPSPIADAGPIYKFSLNHVLETPSPTDLFRFETSAVASAS